MILKMGGVTDAAVIIIADVQVSTLTKKGTILYAIHVD